VPDEYAPRRAERNAAAIAVQEALADLGFQAPDLAAQRGLRNAQGGGGLREAPGLGELQEGLEALEIQDYSLRLEAR
jgi:hypothetical protein